MNLEDNINKIGRIACVKLDNILDAIAILTGEAKLNVPLNNGTNDTPYFYPSKKMIEFIQSYEKENSQINFQAAGKRRSTKINRPCFYRNKQRD